MSLMMGGRVHRLVFAVLFTVASLSTDAVGTRIFAQGSSSARGSRCGEESTDTWLPISQVAAPSPRRNPTAVWTGTEVLVWGGMNTGQIGFGDGAAYDPVSDSWRPLSEDGAPTGRSGHSAVWTGKEMIIWGGKTYMPENPLEFRTSYFADGGRYNPATDTWSPVAIDGAPTPRARHVAVWTGAEMIIWGGGRFVPDAADGARYDPVTDKWTPLPPPPMVDNPGAWELSVAVWDGSGLVLWGGGYIGSHPSAGARWDPTTDSWTLIAVNPVLSARTSPQGFWTGTQIIFWGGVRDWLGVPLSDGGLYDPATDTWTDISRLGAPSPRYSPSVVWTGTQLIVVGGAHRVGKATVFANDDGAVYDVMGDMWRPIASSPLVARQFNASVWTGCEMIVFGGWTSTRSGQSIVVDGGARFRPSTK